MYDFKTDPHFECVGHLTTRDVDVVVTTDGWAPEADGRTLLWFDRHQYFCRTYKSHLVAEVGRDGRETPIYHDVLADTIDVKPGFSYHIWVLAASARPRPDGSLWVEKAASGQGHVKLYRRVAPDNIPLPPKKAEKKPGLLKRLFAK
jgi:hypothetical protein